MPFGGTEDGERAEDTADNRKSAQDEQGHGHDARCLMNIVVAHDAAMMTTAARWLLVVLIVYRRRRRDAAIVPHEDAEEEAEHIERGKRDGEQADAPQDIHPGIAASHSVGQHRTQNIVFTPETREREDAADRQSRDQERPGGDWQTRPQ